jgi:hypothetical protein
LPLPIASTRSFQQDPKATLVLFAEFWVRVEPPELALDSPAPAFDEPDVWARHEVLSTLARFAQPIEFVAGESPQKFPVHPRPALRVRVSIMRFQALQAAP